jgi:hypothetical protein
LIGRVVAVEFLIAADDSSGNSRGDVLCVEQVIRPVHLILPEWWHGNFGRIVSCRLRAGVRYACCKVIRYRVRRPRGMTVLDRCLAQLPPDPREGDPVAPRLPERVDA